MVKNNVNGAYAPSSPELGINPDFLEPTQEMIDWFYRTSDTVSINCYNIDGNCSVVEIVTCSDEVLRVKTETIGRLKKNYIFKNYMFQNFRDFYDTNLK